MTEIPANKISSKKIKLASFVCILLMICTIEILRSQDPDSKGDSQNKAIAPYTKVLKPNEVYDKVEKSVYSIVSGDYSGGAVAVTEDVLVTNCHLLSHRRVIWVNDQKKLMQVINSDYKDIDLCFIYVPDMKLAPVRIKSSADVKIGDQAYAVGNPKGFNKTISRGIVSNKDKQGSGTFLQTDAAISHGSSGGGLFDDKANLIGITSKLVTGGNGIGFAAPTEPITKTIIKIKKTPKDKFRSDANKFTHMLSIIERYDDYETAEFREELALCSRNENIFCTGVLSEIYFDKGWYSLAYPLLLKSSGLPGSSVDYYLASMFKKGLGVNKDNIKAHQFLEKSAMLGDSRAARDIGYNYLNPILTENKANKHADDLQKNLMNGYAWIKISEALGEKTYTYDGDEGPISELLEVLESKIDKYYTLDDANKVVFEICSHIDRCVI